MIALKKCARCEQPALPVGYCRLHERQRGRDRYRAKVGRPVREYFRGPRTRAELLAKVEAALQDERDAQALLDGSADVDVSDRLRLVAEAKRRTAAAIEKLAGSK